MMVFIELLQIALGNKTSLSRLPSEQEWHEAYQTAEKHALVGLLFSAIEKLNENGNAIKPPSELFLEWIGVVMQIEIRNKRVNEAAALLTRLFNQRGLRTCVLKGQGIARLYPQPLRRQTGDVDLWVEDSRSKTLKFLKDNLFGIGKVVIHHVDAHIVDGVETEIHFMPGYTYNPFLHKKIQNYFKGNADNQFSNYDSSLGFAHPTLKFNAVYILSHIYMHFLYEGVGLRQIVDYFYVLKNLNEGERKQAAIDVREVGLLKFAGAVMYVLQQVCGMDEGLLIAMPDKKRGALLLDEIMMSGNFGKYNERLQKKQHNKRIRNNIISFKRQLRFLKYYPLDILCIPFWKTGHWCWRKWNGYL